MPDYTLSAQIVSADGEVLASSTATFHVRHHLLAQLEEEAEHLKHAAQQVVQRELHHHDNE